MTHTHIDEIESVKVDDKRLIPLPRHYTRVNLSPLTTLPDPDEKFDSQFRVLSRIGKLTFRNVYWLQSVSALWLFHSLS